MDSLQIPSHETAIYQSTKLGDITADRSKFTNGHIANNKSANGSIETTNKSANGSIETNNKSANGSIETNNKSANGSIETNNKSANGSIETNNKSANGSIETNNNSNFESMNGHIKATNKFTNGDIAATTDSNNGHITTTNNSNNGHIATNNSNNGHIATKNSNNGHIATTNNSNNGHIATTNNSNNGHIATTNNSNNGHIVAANNSNNGQIATTNNSNNGHIARTNNSNNGHIATTNNKIIQRENRSQTPSARSAVSEYPVHSDFGSTTIDYSHSNSNSSSAMAQSFKPEDTDSETKDRQPGMSRMKQLLARRNAHKQNRWVLSVKRQRLLDEAKEKIKRSEYEAARLSSRLDILNLVVDHALVDDSFLGKKELNPWRFKRPAMDRKYNFVNNMVTAQEMLVMVDEAKQRMRNQQEEKSNQEITEEERVKSTPKNDSTDDAEEDGENEKTLKDKNSKIPCQNVEETSNHVGVDIHKQSDKIESNDDNRENAKGVSSKKKLSPIISRSKSSKVNKLRKHKLKTTKANSNSATSSTIIYAFGSSHNKESCHYCGSVQCAGQLNRNRMNINGNNLTSIGQRISDLRGIYDKESWNSKYSKRIQERIKVIDGELNDKLVNSPSLILRHSKK